MADNDEGSPISFKEATEKDGIIFVHLDTSEMAYHI